jgi:hypothetical protein
MSPRGLVAAWSTAIIIWCVTCAGGWVVATREDYARLAAARACYSTDSQSQSPSSQCANIKPSDQLLYQAAIDRKAAISRVTASLGSMVLIILVIVMRRPGTQYK